MLQQSRNNVAIRGLGVLTGAGVGLQSQLDMILSSSSRKADLTLKEFNPLPHLSDRKMMKAVSATDAYGLVAIEDLKKSSANSHSGTPSNPWRTGLYVGAPAAFASDNENYFDAVRAATGTDNQVAMAAFGRECMNARPNTLLIGLPNNVLCYGSMILGIQGPNSNYTSGDMSGFIALKAAYQGIKRGRIDSAVAGGFAGGNELIAKRVTDFYCLTDPAQDAADGAVFLELTNDGDSNTTPVKSWVCAVAQGSVGVTLGFDTKLRKAGDAVSSDQAARVMERTINSALTDAGISSEHVGLILAGTSGNTEVCQREFLVLSRVFAKGGALPALGSLSPVMGNLMETAGLLELPLCTEIIRGEVLPQSIRWPSDWGQSANVKPKGDYALVLRSTVWGEVGVVVLRCR